MATTISRTKLIDFVVLWTSVCVSLCQRGDNGPIVQSGFLLRWILETTTCPPVVIEKTIKSILINLTFKLLSRYINNKEVIESVVKLSFQYFHYVFFSPLHTWTLSLGETGWGQPWKCNSHRSWRHTGNKQSEPSIRCAWKGTVLHVSTLRLKF